jgi:hypothetical protein
MLGSKRSAHIVNRIRHSCALGVIILTSRIIKNSHASAHAVPGYVPDDHAHARYPLQNGSFREARNGYAHGCVCACAGASEIDLHAGVRGRVYEYAHGYEEIRAHGALSSYPPFQLKIETLNTSIPRYTKQPPLQVKPRFKGKPMADPWA